VGLSVPWNLAVTGDSCELGSKQRELDGRQRLGSDVMRARVALLLQALGRFVVASVFSSRFHYQHFLPCPPRLPPLSPSQLDRAARPPRRLYHLGPSHPCYVPSVPRAHRRLPLALAPAPALSRARPHASARARPLENKAALVTPAPHGATPRRARLTGQADRAWRRWPGRAPHWWRT